MLENMKLTLAEVTENTIAFSLSSELDDRKFYKQLGIDPNGCCWQNIKLEIFFDGDGEDGEDDCACASLSGDWIDQYPEDSYYNNGIRDVALNAADLKIVKAAIDDSLLQILILKKRLPESIKLWR